MKLTLYSSKQFVRVCILRDITVRMLTMEIITVCVLMNLLRLEPKDNLINGGIACKHVEMMCNLHCCAVQACHGCFSRFLPS